MQTRTCLEIMFLTKMPNVCLTNRQTTGFIHKLYAINSCSNLIRKHEYLEIIGTDPLFREISIAYLANNLIRIIISNNLNPGSKYNVDETKINTEQMNCKILAS